jgi:signal peptidase II
LNILRKLADGGPLRTLVEGGRKLFWPAALLMLAADLWTKSAWWAHPDEGRPDIVLIPGLLKFVSHAGNRTGVLGLGPSNPVFWTVLAIVALAVVVLFMLTTPSGNTLVHVALGMVAGGAIGNLVDRIRLGYVRDFIDLHWRNRYHWHTFNWADAVLCAGIVLILYDSFLGSGRAGTEEADGSADGAGGGEKGPEAP